MRRGAIAYSDEELDWVFSHRDMPRKELHKAFQERFGRQDVSVDHIKALCTRKGWSAGRAGRRRQQGVSRIFTEEQIDWLKKNASLSRADVLEAFLKVFPAADITTEQIVSFRKRAKLKTGRDGKFKSGNTSWNKGKKIGSHPNSRSSQFKKGMTPYNLLPIGFERITEDGYVEIKVEEINPYTGAPTRFVQKHRYLWEQAHGKVPDGYALKCLDGDRSNTDPSNWEAVPRGLLPRLNGKCGRNYDQAPREVQPVILATAKLEHALKEKIKGLTK